MQEEWLFHDSHSLECRRPFGAVTCQARVKICLQVRADRIADAVLLRVWQEDTGEAMIPMEPIGGVDEWLRYQVELAAPAAPGLMWYYFLVREGEQVSYYGTGEDGLGGRGRVWTDLPPSYQITVYPANLATPDWFKNAVVYQIFVDRFANGSPDGSLLRPRPEILTHPHWEDAPVYAKDPATGAVLAYDFFGGNLAGVIAKLPYLAELGVNAIYFNPLFDSPSNHKYDTADYKTIDTMFGDNELFGALCRLAAEQGIAVILDGVFSHTGSDSLYFNKYGRYPVLGAFQSTASAYYSWYRFTRYPNDYESWWGVDALPNVNETDPGYLNYIIEAEDSVLRHWQRLGVKGWRLDVADELPEEFIRRFRRVLKEADPEAMLLGEVWEDASRKRSYGTLRRYFHGDELDSVMNYPWRRMLLDFVLGGATPEQTARALRSQCENYPAAHFYSGLNLLGSHDVPRILTLLGEGAPESTLSRAEQAHIRLNEFQRQLAVARFKLLVVWQMTFPGAPCVYYGDEAGLEGYSDPLNRRTYPWGREDGELLSWHKKLIGLRQRYPVLRTGDWEVVFASGDVLGYRRWINSGQDVFGKACPDNTAIILLNRHAKEPVTIVLDGRDWEVGGLVDALDRQIWPLVDGYLTITLQPLAGKVLLAKLEPAAEERQAGILLHVTSLPGPHGSGDLGADAYRFVDFLVAAGQHLWQILPCHPRGAGDSPYQSLSAFAGDPLLIALNPLVERGLITAQEVSDALAVNGPMDVHRAQFATVERLKEPLFRVAFGRFAATGASTEFRKFQAEQGSWLENYSLFMALVKRFGSADWTTWESTVAQRKASDLHYFREICRKEMEYQAFLQYLFAGQWSALKQYANARGIRIIGDLPIFVSCESSDVWANQQLFQLDGNGEPTVVAGVPPDYFSATGQRWGNPLYDWAALEADGYRWWQDRFRHLLGLVDIIRLDHFRGFEASWEIPADEATAVQGQWAPGPGEKFFVAMRKALGSLPIIAEDLGYITPEVRALKDQFAFPGMQVLQFSFALSGTGLCQPIRVAQNSVVYTGTHDNDTTVGWYEGLAQTDPVMQSAVRRYLGTKATVSSRDICRQCVERAYASRAATVIIPLQDILGLGSEARMNIPGTATGNWQWRCQTSAMSSELASELAALVVANRR